MMRRVLTLLFISTALMLAAQAQDAPEKDASPAVAVWPAGSEGVERYVPLVLTKLIEGFLRDTGEYRIVEEEEQKEIASRYGLDYSNLTFDEILKKGGSTAVDYVIYPTVTKDMYGYTVELKLFDLSTGTLMTVKKAAAQSFDLLDLPVENAVIDMTRNYLSKDALVKTRAEEELRIKKEKEIIAETVIPEPQQKEPVPLPVLLRAGSEIAQSAVLGLSNYLLLYRGAVAYKNELRDKTNYNDAVRMTDLFTDGGERSFGDYNLTSGIGYALSGLSAGTGAAADIYLPVSLSKNGRIVYGFGLFFDLFFFGVSHTSMLLIMESEEEYDNYLQYSGSGPEDYFSKYRTYREYADALAVLGLSGSVITGIVKSLSPTISGEKRSVLDTRMKKALFIAGDSCFALGSIAGGISFLSMQRRQEVYLEYSTATANVGALSSELDRLETSYTAAAVSAYSFYAAGVILKAVALWLPEAPGTDVPDGNEQKVSVRVSPVPYGGIVTLRF